MGAHGNKTRRFSSALITQSADKFMFLVTLLNFEISPLHANKSSLAESSTAMNKILCVHICEIYCSLIMSVVLFWWKLAARETLFNCSFVQMMAAGKLVDWLMELKTKSEINAHIFVFNKALVDDKSAVKFLSVQIQLISRCHANETQPLFPIDMH